MLTDTKARNAKFKEKTYQLHDFNGLYIEIQMSCRKVWRYHFYMPNGKDGRYTIGNYPDVSLQDARRIRDEVWALCRQEINPNQRKKELKHIKALENYNTFEAISKEWMLENKKNWSDSYALKAQQILAGDVWPTIGEKPIKDITSAEILAIMQVAKNRNATTIANKIRQLSSAVFCYAIRTLRAEYDVAAPLKGAIIQKATEHAKCLTESELKKLYQLLAACDSHRSTVIAIELLAITFTRTTELRSAEWAEIDFKNGLWTIPAERMKKKRTHVVPLPKQAITLLVELKEITGYSQYLFPSTQSKEGFMGRSTINNALERMGFNVGDISGHDFRATASTWLLEADFESSWVDMQLAHSAASKTEAAYNHARYLKQRKDMLQWWADKIDFFKLQT